MGMEHMVVFASENGPSWTEVRAVLERVGFLVQMRMIDGHLVMPTEVPADSWTELRLGTAQGMVTVRREIGRVRAVTWGNASPEMRQVWNAVAWAFAEAGGGRIETPDGSLTAAEFRQRAELPASP